MPGNFLFPNNRGFLDEIEVKSKILKVFLVALMTAVTLNIVVAPKAASQDFPSERAGIHSLDYLSENSYFFNEWIVDPSEPLPGEEQTFSIWARHPVGIREVTATVSYEWQADPVFFWGGKETIELNLVEGTEEEGRLGRVVLAGKWIE